MKKKTQITFASTMTKCNLRTSLSFSPCCSHKRATLVRISSSMHLRESSGPYLPKLKRQSEDIIVPSQQHWGNGNRKTNTWEGKGGIQKQSGCPISSKRTMDGCINKPTSKEDQPNSKNKGMQNKKHIRVIYRCTNTLRLWSSLQRVEHWDLLQRSVHGWKLRRGIHFSYMDDSII
jgi:hypothetical protein